MTFESGLKGMKIPKTSHISKTLQNTFVTWFNLHPKKKCQNMKFPLILQKITFFGKCTRRSTQASATTLASINSSN